MKAFVLKYLRLFYLGLPLPRRFKTRVKSALSSRLQIVERIVLAAQPQAADEDVAAALGVGGAGEAVAVAVATPSVEAAVIVARGGSLVSAFRRSIGYVPDAATSYGDNPPPVRAMAFYLPQFHPIKENDEWWGKGFTEWSNVTRARPQVEGQWQPHLPGELGFYDLRTPGIMRRQAELAVAHGIEGFCFYFYWFGGKRLLERPLLDFLADKAVDISFSLCWANENWTRRWDGLDEDILVGQDHSIKDDISFIEYVSQYMQDSRYVRIDGKPLLIVYRPSLLPDPAATAQRWRVRCRELGIGEIYLAFTLAFDSFEPANVGFDGTIEFPPNKTFPRDITDSVLALNPGFVGHVYDWRSLVTRSRAYLKPLHDVFRGVCPSWDNEARKSGRGTVLLHSSPQGYEEWLENAARDTVLRFDAPDRRLLFINAWNEWAEGAHLEPDSRFGYAYLQATRRALHKASHPKAPKGIPKRVVVVIHAYYPELLPEIIEQLRTWDVAPRVIVTTAYEKEAGVREIMQELLPDAECLAYENKGRDILPFLKLAGNLLDSGEELLLKLHTKKSLHREDGDVWRRDLLEKLTSPDQVRGIVEAFRKTADLRLVAPEGHILSMDTYWGSNASTVDYLCRRMDISPPRPESAAFPAGSMFYVNLNMLTPLLNIHLDEAEFEPELGQVDGTMAHAIERIFGVLATCGDGILASSEEPGTRFSGHLTKYAYADASQILDA